MNRLYFRNGVLVREINQHRPWPSDEDVEIEDVQYFPDGSRVEREYLNTMPMNVAYRDSAGELHRLDGPASIHYRGGIIYDEVWYVHGHVHRDDGPAVTAYDEKGRKVGEKWFQDGVKVDEKEYS